MRLSGAWIFRWRGPGRAASGDRQTGIFVTTGVAQAVRRVLKLTARDLNVVGVDAGERFLTGRGGPTRAQSEDQGHEFIEIFQERRQAGRSLSAFKELLHGRDRVVRSGGRLR